MQRLKNCYVWQRMRLLCRRYKQNNRQEATVSNEQITREEWEYEHCFCFACRVFHIESPYALHTHGIPRGVFRQRALKVPAAWLRLCLIHHDEVDDLSVWLIARQLALKYLMDKKHYDRVAVNLLRGRQPEAITEAEVMVYVRQFKEANP